MYIREINIKDLDEVAKIWLHTNISAHSFIDESYWRDNFEAVRDMFMLVEVYVCEDEAIDEICGFIGVNDEHIEGIFVRCDMQSKGIGHKLLECVKSMKDKLTLNVYLKNERAIRFYEKEGFVALEEGYDEETGEKDCLMIWQR